MILQPERKLDSAHGPLLPGPLREIVAVVACIIALVLAWAMGIYPRELSTTGTGLYISHPGAGVSLFAILYAIFSLLAYRTRPGIYIGFQYSAIVAAYLALGPAAAVLTSAIGAILAELGHYAFSSWLNQRRHSAYEMLSLLFFNASVYSAATLLSGTVYLLLGGTLPMDPSRLALAIPVAAMLIVNQTLQSLAVVLVMRWRGQAIDFGKVKESAFILVSGAFFSMVLAALLPVAYYELPPISFLTLSSVAVLLALLFRMSEQSHRALERRVEEMATLNSIGQSIASSLAMSDLMQSLYDQISRLMEVHSFYVALYTSDIPGVLTFPFAIRNGQRVAIEALPNVYGVVEHITSTRRPLLLRGSVNAELVKLGIQPTEPDDSACFLGVPLIVDDEVTGMLGLYNKARPDAYRPSDVAVLSAIAAQAATALHNASLYNRVWEMADELALLNNVSSVVTATLDLNIVLDTTCAVVIQIGHADKTAIFLISEDGQTLQLVHSTGLSDDYVAQFQDVRRDDDTGPTQAIHQHAAMAIPDVRTDPRGLGWRTLAEIEGYVGLLTVPLVTNDQVIGFLAAYYQQPHLFGKSELDLMSTLANQVAVTVVNARLFQEAQARAQEMTRLVEASRAFTASLDLNSVAEKVLDELAGLLTPDLMAIMEVSPEASLLHPLAARGVESVEAMVPAGSIARAIATCKVATLPDSTDDLALLRQFDLKSLYVIPLVSQDKVIGVVLVGHKAIRQLTVRERQLTEALVNQAATAVRNAELYSQTDAALAARVTELSAIESISRQISGSLDLDSIINDVLDTALVVTGAEEAGCGLVTDPEFLNFSERYSAAINMPPIRRVLRLGEGVIGRVMRTGQITCIGDVRTDPDYRRLDLSDTLSELCVPIIHRQECVGILNLESRRPDAFTESHAQFMANLADHAAIAIQNVRLFEERQLQIDTLIKLRDLSLSLLSATSLNAVLSVIVEYTLIISRAKDVHLYLYDRATDLLTFGASLWLDGRENIEASKPERGGTTWQVARTGRSQIIEDVSQLQPAPQFRNGPGYAAIARIALRRGNQVMGVLIIAYREPHHFSDTEMRMLDLLAYQAAIAIENARLFDEVRAGRDQMQVILDSTRDGMMLIGANGELVLANPAAERLLNQALQRFTGMPMMRLVARLHRQADDPTNGAAIVYAIRNILASIDQNPNSAARSAFQMDVQGTLIDVEVIVLPVRDKAGLVSGRLVVLRDVSEEKSLDRFRWQLTDMVVHDLRAPLSAVISGLQMAQDMAAEGDFTDLDQVISIALNSSRSQMYNIESILEIAKLESAGHIPLNMAVCPLKLLVDRAITAINQTAYDAGVRVVDRVTDDIPPLWVDEAQIRRVLINLLDNALRHTPTNGEVRIEATPVSGRDYVQISVIDTGRGIPIDARERVFEKFYQLSRSALRGQRGFGLGLTFCKLSIEAHGGKIWVEDGPEGGAAFRFTLPFATQEHES